MKLNEYIISDNNFQNRVCLFSINESGQKCVLIKSADERSQQKLKTDNMLLKTNTELCDEKGEWCCHFHIIHCLSQDIGINDQFQRVFKYVFEDIVEEVSSSFIINLFQDLQLLFETSSDPDTRKLQIGVYGELVFLKYLLQKGRKDLFMKWHTDFFSKHDIEINENNRIEIKTTNQEKRVHTFRHNQLVQKNISIFIASVKIEECKEGKALFDLILEMEACCENIEQKNCLERLIRRCNLSPEARGISCDEQHVFDGIKVFDAKDVPHLIEIPPVGITNIEYDVNLDIPIPEIGVEKLPKIY